MDLLNLARTNKDYRRILMNSNSASVWKAARQHIEGLPECPPFLSEPAFANLAFDHHCHVRTTMYRLSIGICAHFLLQSCLKPNVKTVCWPLRARYCNQCKKIKSVYRCLLCNISDLTSFDSTIPDFKIDIPDVRVAYMRNPPISLIFGEHSRDVGMSALILAVPQIQRELQEYQMSRRLGKGGYLRQQPYAMNYSRNWGCKRSGWRRYVT